MFSSDWESLSDEDLVAKLQSGAETALRLLIRRHERLLRRFAYGIVFSREQAKEIAQDTFADFWDYYVQRNREVRNVRALLLRIARNRSVDWVRKQRVRSFFRLKFRAIEIASDDPRERIELDETEEIILEAIRKLPRKDSEILELKCVENLTISEVAEVLSIGEEAANSRVRRAKQRLRKILPEFAV